MAIHQLFSFGGKNFANWFATLSSSGSEVFTSVATYDGAIYAAGYTNNGGSDNEAFVAKFSSGGALEWQKLLGATGTNTWNSVAANINGCYVGGYYTVSTLTRPSIAHYNTGGALQWQRELFGAESDSIDGIALDSSSNIYITGNVESQIAGNGALIAKYNSSGTIQWQRSLGGAAVSTTEWGRKCAVDSTGSIYVAGDTTSQTTDRFGLLTKYNTSGTIQFQRSCGTSTFNNFFRYIALNSAGTAVYVAGLELSTGGAGSYDLMVAKFDTSGNLTWQRRIGAATNDLAAGIAVDSNEDVYAATGDNVVKYNSGGTLQWNRSFSGASISNITVSGTNLILCGIKGTDAFIAKVPTDGTKTGTYGGVTYATGTWTAGTNPANTVATRTLTDAARTLTSSTSSLTDTTTTLTDTVTEVP
jgi:hypothetical protein